MSLRLAAPSPCRSFVASVGFLAAMLLTSSAHAAHWAVTYSCSGSNSGGDYSTHQPFLIAWTSGASPNTGYAYWTSGQSSGTITPVLTWTLDAGETVLPPAPAYTVAQINSSARAYISVQGLGTNMIAKAEDSLDGAGTATMTLNSSYSNCSCQVSGMRFVLVSNASLSTTVSLNTVSANASSSATGSNPGGYGSIGVTVYAAPVVVTLSGTTKDTNGSDNILIGQGCTAYIQAGPLPNGTITFSNFNWTVPGQTFAQFQVATDQSAGQAIPVDSTEWTKPNPHWYWSKDEAVTVSCTATVSVNGAVLGTVTGQRAVTIWAPDYLFKPLAGPVSVGTRSASGGPLSLQLYAGGPADANGVWDPPGVKNGGRVSTPNLFRLSPTGNAGTGSWEFGQIIFPGRWLYYYDNAGSPQVAPLNYNGQKLLDNSWPYQYGTAGAPWAADSVDQSPQPNIPTYWMEDSPGNGLVDYYYREKADESFNDYMMYLPPEKGNGSQWVPLHLFAWKWQADVSRFGTWAIGWSPQPPGYTSIISSARCTTHPQWSGLLTNTGMHF